MKKWIVDRIEGETAVCEAENRTHFEIPLAKLPPVTEGDVLVENNGEIHVDAEETQKRRERIAALSKSLFQKKED